MIQEARRMVSNFYEVLSNESEFTYLKNIYFELQVCSENYLFLTDSLKKALLKTRKKLNELSMEVEEMADFVSKIKSTLDREREKKIRMQEREALRVHNMKLQKYSKSLAEISRIVGSNESEDETKSI